MLKIKDITDFLWTPEMKELTDALLHLNWRLTEQSDPAWVEKHEKNLLNTCRVGICVWFRTGCR